MHAIIHVLVFPPSESLSSLVSFESRYGTNDPILFLSLKMFIQFPRASKLLFICLHPLPFFDHDLKSKRLFLNLLDLLKIVLNNTPDQSCLTNFHLFELIFVK